MKYIVVICYNYSMYFIIRRSEQRPELFCYDALAKNRLTSLRSLSFDMSVASSKASSTHSSI